MIRKMVPVQPSRPIRTLDHPWKFTKKRNSWSDQYVIFTLGKWFLKTEHDCIIVVFSDGGSTTIAPKSGITARQLLTSVATRRGLSPGKQNREKNVFYFYSFYYWFLWCKWPFLGCIDWLLLNEGLNQESLSLENDSTCLSGRHIRGELRVTFRYVTFVPWFVFLWNKTNF